MCPIHDVSDAFDSTFLDEFTVVRRVQIVNTSGRTVITKSSFVANGVVQPTSPDDLNRLPEMQYMEKSISIYTQCKIQGPSLGFQSDEILWHGSSYIVRVVDDYSGYGKGFTMVVCQSLDSVDPPPPYSSALTTTMGSA